MITNPDDINMNPNARQVFSPVRNIKSPNWRKVWIGTGDYVALKTQQEEEKFSSFILPNSKEKKFQKWLDGYLYSLIFKRMKRRVNESKRVNLACLHSLQKTVGRIRSLSPQIQSPMKSKEIASPKHDKKNLVDLQMMIKAFD